MDSVPSLSNEPAGFTQQVPDVVTSTRPVAIPWGAYYVVYFVQAVIMSMILTNVPVFLRQGLSLDWLALTASFVVMVIPVALRPLFAWVTDRRPAALPVILVSGLLLVIIGGTVACAGASAGPVGLAGITIGFAVSVVGATCMNVSADSHIVRAVPLDLSARVNSRKRVAAFLGIVLGQGCYLLLVGTRFTDFARWAMYFAVPAIVAAATWVIYALKHGWRILSSVEGLPPMRAPWLVRAEAQAATAQQQQRTPRLFFIMLLAIFFAFSFPDGLVETTFENFVVDIYGHDAWMLYSSIIVFGVFFQVAGYVLAGRSGKRPPEWDFLWYVPVLAAFDALMWATPPFLGVLVPVLIIQVPTSFILVRLLQSWQSHSYTRRPALTFQVFFATYELGKLAGIGISGPVMAVVGYSGIFAGAVITWAVVMGLVVAYLSTRRK